MANKIRVEIESDSPFHWANIKDIEDVLNRWGGDNVRFTIRLLPEPMGEEEILHEINMFVKNKSVGKGFFDLKAQSDLAQALSGKLPSLERDEEIAELKKEKKEFNHYYKEMVGLKEKQENIVKNLSRLLVICCSTIADAIYQEDGLDGSVGQDLIKDINKTIPNLEQLTSCQECDHLIKENLKLGYQLDQLDKLPQPNAEEKGLTKDGEEAHSEFEQAEKVVLLSEFEKLYYYISQAFIVIEKVKAHEEKG